MKRARLQVGSASFKLRLVFVPWLLVAVGFIAVYSLLHWLLIVAAPSNTVSDTLVNAVLPLALPWLPILLCLRPGIRLLAWHKNDPTIGYIAAWLLIAIPSMVTQLYIEETAGSISRLERIGQLNATPRTRFYSVQQFVVDKAQSRRGVRNWVSGKNSANWNVGVYYTAPLRDALEKPDAVMPAAWLGLRYEKQFSNRSSENEKRVWLDEWVKEAQRKFTENDFRWISYFSTVRTTDERKGFSLAMQSDARSPAAVNALILRPHDGAFESRGGSKLTWSLGLFGGGAALWLLLVLAQKVDPGRLREWQESRRTARGNEMRAALSFLIPRRSFLVTPILLHLNLLVWLAMVGCGLAFDSASPSELLAWGGVSGPTLHDGAIWRLFTSLFVHANAMHFFNNMGALLLVGLFVEDAFGPRWSAGVYLITGVASGIATVLWQTNTVLVGASGSIFGLMGFGLALLLVKRERFSSTRPLVLKAAAVYLGVNLLLGIFLPGISLIAHVAGLLSGVLLGLGAVPVIKDRPAQTGHTKPQP